MGVYWQQLNTFDIERRNQSRLVAEGLRQTADQLTRLAQAYIGTKNPVHVQNYLVIREILDDKRTLTDSVASPAAFQGMPPLALSTEIVASTIISVWETDKVPRPWVILVTMLVPLSAGLAVIPGAFGKNQT